MQKTAWVNTFGISAVVSCVILNEKKKNNVGDGWLKRGMQDQKMYTKEKLRQLKEQVKWCFKI